MRIDPPAPASSMASGRGSKTGSSTPTPCCSKVGMKRGPWTPEEDEILASYIRREGEGRWRTLPKRAGLLRCGKSCRLRWMNYLRPNVKRGQIAPDEEDLILRLHRLLGNRWSLIAGRIPGRTDNEIKNYWNTHLSKKLISQGIDPRTHKPLNPNLVSSGTLPAAPAPEPSPRPPSIGGAAEASRIGPGGEKTYLGHDIRRHEGLDGFHIAADTNQRRGAVANENRHNSEELAKVMGLEGSHENRNEEDGLDYCTDDIFSSFLNSLINEDTLMQQPQNGLFAPSDPSCVMIPTPSFGYGGIRDSSMKAAAPESEGR